MDEYTVQINGMPHTLLLDKEGLKMYPDAEPVKKANTKQASAPANKSATAKNK